MGQIKQPQPVKLIMPMLARDGHLFDAAEGPLVDRFGPIDYRSALLPFAHTSYYERELGAHPLRRFVAMEHLIDPGALAEIKRWTNELETTFADQGSSRPLNLDPGYVSGAKLVLATTKNHAHRIYLGQGIYAEVTLIYRDGAFQSLPWTYPDYASASHRQIMAAIRAIYLDQVKELARQQ